MHYKQTREIVIFPFIMLSETINIVSNDVLEFPPLEITYHLLLALGLGWFVGLLFWNFISGHYLNIALSNLTIDKSDIKVICSVISKYKLTRTMTYIEFDKVVKDATEVCTAKIDCPREDLEMFVLAAACFDYKILWYGTFYRGLKEVKYLEKENYDAVKMIEHFQAGQIRKGI